MRKVIGWVILLIGLGGLLSNFAFVMLWHSGTAGLIINSIICIILAYGGYSLIRKPIKRKVE